MKLLSMKTKRMKKSIETFPQKKIWKKKKKSEKKNNKNTHTHKKTKHVQLYAFACRCQRAMVFHNQYCQCQKIDLTQS